MNGNQPGNQLPDQAAPHSPEERFAALWTDYLEGELDADGMAELNGLLAADERLVIRAADLYQLHRRLGVLAARRRDATAADESSSFIDDVMRRLPGDGETLARAVMARIAPPYDDDLTAAAGSRGTRRWDRLLIGGGLMAAAAVAMLMLGAQMVRDALPRRGLPDAAAQVTAPPSARFASLDRARFLGRGTPARETAVDLNENYVLSAGLVEIAFPLGATAIIEGPAVFRVCGADCLAVDAGRCSVHAPEGAEGFRVETPATRVIDRGTRFVVNVDETSTTEVQVIEGAADLIAKADQSSVIHRVVSGGVARHDPASRGEQIVTAADGADRSAYRAMLPDRLVGYSASLSYPAALVAGDSSGLGIDTLESMSIQRGGVVRTYGVTALIGVRVIHFHGTRNQSNLTLPGQPDFTAATLSAAEARRALLEADHLLTTGVINPGGATSPLTADPVLAAGTGDGAASTPGLAVTFTHPVVNEAGPDAILFELQMLTDPPEGDAFHVSPLRFKPGLRSRTITTYDIDSTSPESQLLAPFRLFSLDQKSRSLAELLQVPTNAGTLQPVRARANAVAIDLSDLGYAEGDACQGLFIQDADDDATTIDPVFIAGLPPLDKSGHDRE
jgi:hypothetical protein